MDFLDPKRKKAHRQRLLLGYILMAIAVAMGTLILLFSAYGYDIDRKTGSVIQNGTVFIDSLPGGSNIEIDGVMQSNRTATRLVLPGSKIYSIKLTNDGYEDWTRSFALAGGQIERITYPLLIPKLLTTTDDQLYASAPGISSQSPDRRWLLVQQPGNPLVFDLYDLNSPASEPVNVAIPTALLSEPAQASVISVVEWSNDNNHVLLDRAYAGKHEFLLIDTEDPNGGININTAFNVAPAAVRLRDKKPDQLHILTADTGALSIADTNNRVLSPPILTGVVEFKSYGSDIILYATKTGAADGKVSFRIRENEKGSYLLREIPDGTKYLMDVSVYDGTPHYVVGTSSVDSVFVYRDPLPILKGQRSNAILVSDIVRISSPQFVTFSASSQYISAQNANDISVLDLESDRQFKLNLNHPIDASQKIAWMDGSRFSFVSGGVSHMIDFDGSNERRLVPALAAGGPYFAPDFRTVFTVAPSTAVNGRFAFTQTSLIKK